MKGQQTGFNSVVAVGMAALFIVAAKTADDYRNAWVKGAQADARTETYFAEHSGSFCAFEGVGMTGRTTKRSRLAVLM